VFNAFLNKFICNIFSKVSFAGQTVIFNEII